MNTKKIFGYGLFAVILALAFIACETEPAHEHQWGAWSVTTAATCVAEGVETRTCQSDGTAETRPLVVDPDAHDWDEWKDITQYATCIETGIGKKTCKLNSEHIETVIPIDDDAHDWKDEYEQTTDPTCEEEGVETDTCKREETHTRTKPVAALGHDWKDYVPTAATKTEDGFKTRTCGRSNTHMEIEFSGEYATGTVELAFVALGSFAYCVSKGTATGDIVIPAYHRPNATSPYRPVTQISNGTDTEANNAFGRRRENPDTDVTSITVLADEKGTYQLETISQRAFNHCSNLTSIEIPAGVTYIGIYAFSGCSSLTSVTIPAGVTSINNQAFEYCRNLASVTIPDSVTFIGENAFLSCTSLTSVTIPNSVTSIGENAFLSCTSLTSVTIPNSVTSIGNYAFGWCSELTSITIPASVTTIGSAFFYCDSLASVTFSGNATTIGTDTFMGSNFKTFYDSQTTKAGTYTTTSPVSATSTWTKSS